MKFLHTMIRVTNIEDSLEFYCQKLGLVEIRRKDVPEGKFTLIFLAAPEDENTAIQTRSPEIELTYNWDQKTAYEHGNSFGHLAIAVPNAYKTCDNLEKDGIYIPRPAGPMKGSERVIAFIEDPDGYKIELVQRD